ncbi:MAG TPA: DUF2273 domain-containing protein [Bacilli bacterium]|nr:DUF2273 domain-containing protein [Bacilli bacterium]
MERLLTVVRYLLEHKSLLGLCIGVLFGLLFLIVGLFKTIVFALIVTLGYYIGKMWDDREDWRDVIERILPAKYRE